MEEKLAVGQACRGAVPCQCIPDNAFFLRRAREALGQPYFDFLIQDYDPALGWPELAEQQRLKAQGFIISGGEALQVDPGV